MFIEPNTNIKILKDVPLDNTYEHTLYFSTKNEQLNYFISLKKYDLLNYTYQRVKRGYSRIGIKAENLYDCNYMMFQNTSFGDKWFYAFIKSVEYVNNECSEIEFEIDVMQTWFFEYELESSFVDREHSVTDGIGDNLVPENVNTGELIYNNYFNHDSMKKMCVIVATLDKEGEIEGKLYDGIYGGCTLTGFKSTSVDKINLLLSKYQQKFENVVSIYMLPEICMPDGWVDGAHLPLNSGASNFDLFPTNVSSVMTLDTYKPRNNKLYTYPYNYLVVDNSMGDTLPLRYEFFSSDPHLRVYSMVTNPVTLSLRPVGYKIPDTLNPNNTEQLTMTNFPICSWGVDSYQAYIAQQSVRNINTGVNGVANTITGLATGNIVGGIRAGAQAIGDILSSNTLLSMQSDISRGGVGTNNVCVANGINTFNYGRVSLNRTQAKIIDDYFTRFGYATRELKKPNIKSRPHFNYVKTIQCCIKGSIPSDDMRKICNIYDTGITFWKHGNEVGNYTLDNSPM